MHYYNGDFNLTQEEWYGKLDEYYIMNNKRGLKVLVPLGVAGVGTLLSLVLNALVLAVVTKRPRLHNFPYIILACIAFIDILNSFWGIWYIVMLDGSYSHEPIVCKLSLFLPNFLSILFPVCLCALAIFMWKTKERLQFGEERDVKKSVLVVLLLCLFSAALSYPFLHFGNYYELKRARLTICGTASNSFYPIYKDILRLSKYGVFSIILITSLVMAKRGREKEVVEVDEEGEVVKQKNQLDKRFGSIIFVIWLIYLILGIASEIPTNFYEYYRKMDMVVVVLTYLPVFYKFFLYKGLDKNFKNEFNALFARAI